MPGVLTSSEEGFGELVRKVGPLFIESALESGVEQIAGPHSCRRNTRQAYRWRVKKKGFCSIDGNVFRLHRRASVSAAVKNLPWETHPLF
jgi:hypothetical protein